MHYKILCIDDEPAWVDSIEGDIVEHLRELGFEPEIIRREDGGEIDEFVYRADIDLILVDYNLQEGRGDALIEHILRKGCFLEIVFYSQEPAEIFKALGAHSDQVHCMHRDEVHERVITLTTCNSQKLRDINVMRGLVLAESIEVENLLEDLMVKSFGDAGEYFREVVLDVGAYEFMGKYKFAKRLLDRKREEYMSLAGQDEGAREDRGEHLRKIDECRTALKRFTDDVITPRNVVAHGKKTMQADGTLRIQGIMGGAKDSIDFSKEWVMERRVILAKYRAMLTDLLAMDIW